MNKLGKCIKGRLWEQLLEELRGRLWGQLYKQFEWHLRGG